MERSGRGAPAAYTGRMPASSMRTVRVNMPCRWLRGRPGEGHQQRAVGTTGGRPRRTPRAPGDVAGLARELLLALAPDDGLRRRGGGLSVGSKGPKARARAQGALPSPEKTALRYTYCAGAELRAKSAAWARKLTMNW